MTRRRTLGTGALTTLLALGLAGCGGSSDPFAGMDLPSASPVAAPPQAARAVPARVAPRHVAVTTQPAPPATSSAPMSTASAPAPPPVVPPAPVECPPPPAAGPTGSHLVFGGACAFVETRAVPCPNNGANLDDYYIRFERPMRNHLTMYVSIDVEHYKGPGAYDGTAQIIVEIPDNSTIYEWSTSTGTVTVDAGEHTGSLPHQSLPPDVGTPTHGTETLEGTFRCSGP